MRYIAAFILTLILINNSIADDNPLLHQKKTVKVGQWERFETSVEHTKNYQNPYSDVTLNVTYRKPDNTIVKFWGFYDGDSIWKIRFMPDQTGLWKYSASFSDGSPGFSGTFNCVPSNIPGMVSVDEENPVWFGYKGGKHLVVRSFHVGDRFFAENWSDDKRKKFLDWVQSQGYNMLSIASHYLNRNAKERGLGWNTPDLWPLNAGEYRRMETILNELAKRGIMVFPFAGFFGQDSDFPINHKEQEQYIKYTLARLGPYWNILFNVAGPEPILHPKKFRNAMKKEDVIRLGKLIKKLDVFGHSISIHNKTGDDPFKDEDWLSYVTLQGWKDANLDSISAGILKNHHKSKPLYAQEILWPGNKYHKVYDDTGFRKKAFVLIMSGAAVNYADMDGNSSTGFSGTMNLLQKVQSRHDIIKKVWDFFETIPFYRMKPRQDLVDNGYCLAEPGRQYLVYLEKPGTININIEEGLYAVEWINAQNTKDVRSCSTTGTGKNIVSPNDCDDWILYMVRKE